MDTSLLLWGVLFSSVGFGYFLYGKRQQTPVPLACGIALMFCPYFIANTLLLVSIGVALAAVPYFTRS